MNISDYRRLVTAKNFNEYPDYNTGTELVSAFVIYGEADRELKQ